MKINEIDKELNRIKEWLNKNILTEEEFQKIKDNLLSQYTSAFEIPTIKQLNSTIKEVLIKTTSYVFSLGSPKDEKGRDDNEDEYEAVLTNDFYIATTPTTQKQFKNIMGYNHSRFKDCLDCPVDTVNWHEAAAFCNALSKQEGLPECYDIEHIGNNIQCQVKPEYTSLHYYNCKGYRLPTEAEWEYACRADSLSALYNKEVEAAYDFHVELNKIAWYRNNSIGRTHPVGEKEPNQWGLYDMLGNVNEWVYDTYTKDRSFLSNKNPIHDDYGSHNIIRGGNWNALHHYCRNAFRKPIESYIKNHSIGFRVVRTK